MNSNSRTYNSIINMFFSLGNQVATLLLSFFSRYIFIRILGNEYLGINGLFSDILMMLSLADLGLGTAMVYSFYKPLANNDNKKIIALINFYKKIYRIIAISVSIIGISLIPLLNYIVKVEEPIPHLKLYYILFLLNSIASYLFIYKSSIINADQKGYIISIYSTIINIIKIIVQTVILLITKNYILYLIIQILSTVATNLFIANKANKLYPYLNEKYELDLNEKNDIFKNIKSVFIYKISVVLLNGTDNMLISTLVGTVWVGYYSNYNMIIGTISRFITSAFSSLTASIGNLVVNDDNLKKYRIFKTMQVSCFILAGIISICLYLLIGDFIKLWIGSEFVLDNFILFSILVNFYIASVLPPIWSYREATGLFNKIKYIMIITAIVNLILSVLLGIKFKTGGVILASAIAKLITYFWYEPIVLFKSYFKVSTKRYFISHCINVLFVIMVFFITKYISAIIVVENWIDFIIKAIICFIVSSVIFIILYSRTEEFNILLKKIVNTLIRKG